MGTVSRRVTRRKKKNRWIFYFYIWHPIKSFSRLFESELDSTNFHLLLLEHLVQAMELGLRSWLILRSELVVTSFLSSSLCKLLLINFLLIIFFDHLGYEHRALLHVLGRYKENKLNISYHI